MLEAKELVACTQWSMAVHKAWHATEFRYLLGADAEVTHNLHTDESVLAIGRRSFNYSCHAA